MGLSLKIRNTNYNHLLLLLALLAMFSCVSLQNNYIGKSKVLLNDSIQSVALTEKQKLQLQNKSDSLLKIISEKKGKNKHLDGREINLLYSGFADQLNSDLYYQSILEKYPVTTDSLSYDQYLAALELMSSATNYEKSYQSNRTARRAINRGDPGNNIPRRILYKSQNFLYSPSVRKTLEADFSKFYNAETDSLFKLLPATSSCKALRKRFFRNNDFFHSLIYSFVYTGSFVVGNTIGLFHSKTDRSRNEQLLAPQLLPFDIVLMKSPHHLTDQFIPGYFGHVGIWLGNDLASKLAHKPTKTVDTKGKAMVEVLRSGVKISSLHDFCDGDIFLIIRLPNLTDYQKKSILTNVSKQLKKDYDFNFDIESPESITCTELVYLTYDFIDWETRYTWSRYTLSPDDLVHTAIKSNQFELPAVVKDGLVIDHPDSTIIRSLIGQSAE